MTENTIIPDRLDPADLRVKKRSVRISGHNSSITIEEPFWKILKDVAQKRNISLNTLISEIDALRPGEHTAHSGGLSGALRIYALHHLERQLDKRDESKTQTQRRDLTQ